MSAALAKVCPECGTVTPSTYCDEHRPKSAPKARSTKARGYGTTWRKLSERARRAQPWCSDCGTTSDLTTDHTPEAWRRVELGLAIRLADVDVVCRPCNARRGAARGPKTRGEGATGPLPDPRRQAKLPSHTTGGLPLFYSGVSGRRVDGALPGVNEQATGVNGDLIVHDALAVVKDDVCGADDKYGFGHGVSVP